MKKTRILTMLGIAVLAGLVAVMLASRWLNQQTTAGLSKVAVAAVDISLGQRLAPELIQLVDWPKGSTPPGAFNEAAALEGRVLKTSILRGEPVLEAKLAPQGTSGGLSAVIGEGMRAITVRVNDVIGVAGFALPGNYVDVIVNTQRDIGDQSSRDKTISKIVLERILVLAVAQEVSRDETKPKVVNAVTLEVSPEQAEMIDLARSVGSLSLVLRNQVDPKPVSTVGATKATLLDDKQFVVVKATSKTPPADARPVRAVAPTRAGTGKAQATPTAVSAAGPAPAPVTVPPAAMSRQSCIGVINGLRNSQECY